MEIVRPGDVGQQAEETSNPFSETFFSFTRPELSGHTREFVDLVRSGIFWEDGSALTLGLVGDRHMNIIPKEGVVGGVIDTSDSFWSEERDEGASYLDLFVEHHVMQNSVVAFGHESEVNDPDKIGAGLFRLSVDASMGSGDVRWASYHCFPPAVVSGGRDEALQATIDRLRENEELDVWVFDSLFSGQMTGEKLRRTTLLAVFPEALPIRRAHYKLEKAVTSKVRRKMERRANHPAYLPDRARRTALVPIPCFANPLYDCSVTVEHYPPS